jgi:hypothetical protein
MALNPAACLCQGCPALTNAIPGPGGRAGWRRNSSNKQQQAATSSNKQQQAAAAAASLKAIGYAAHASEDVVLWR